jgi:hypothetical protein
MQGPNFRRSHVLLAITLFISSAQYLSPVCIIYEDHPITKCPCHIRKCLVVFSTSESHLRFLKGDPRIPREEQNMEAPRNKIKAWNLPRP